MYLLAIKEKKRSGNKKSKLSKSAFTPAQVYVRFAKKNFLDIAETFNQISICCEKCNILYHFIRWYWRWKQCFDRIDIWNCINCSFISKFFKKVYIKSYFYSKFVKHLKLIWYSFTIFLIHAWYQRDNEICPTLPQIYYNITFLLGIS